MRFFSSFITVCAIVLSANAATIHKRAAANVETCVSNLNSITGQIDILQSSIQAGGIVDTSINYDRLQDAVKASQGSCCSINTAVSDADADYVIGVVGNVTPKVQGVLSVIAEKAKDYNFLTVAVVKLRIREFDHLTGSLNTCLVNFTPEAKKSSLQAYIDSMNLAFTSTRGAYGI